MGNDYDHWAEQEWTRRGAAIVTGVPRPRWYALHQRLARWWQARRR